MKLPLYWSTAVRHILLHIVPKMKRFASFWAHSLLPEERHHVLIKKCVRSRKNLLVAIAKNHGGYCRSRKVFRVSPEYKWANTADAGSIAVRNLVGRTKNIITYKIIQRHPTRILDRELLDQVMDQYSIQHKWVKTLTASFRVARSASGRDNYGLRDYEATFPNLTDNRRCFVGMQSKVKVPILCFSDNFIYSIQNCIYVYICAFPTILYIMYKVFYLFFCIICVCNILICIGDAYSPPRRCAVYDRGVFRSVQNKQFTNRGSLQGTRGRSSV